MQAPHPARLLAPVAALCGLAACSATRAADAGTAARADTRAAQAQATAQHESAADHESAAQPQAAAPAAKPAPRAAALAEFELTVPGSTAKLVLKPVPGGEVTVSDPAADGGARRETVGPRYVASTEISWDMYDAFVFAMDRGEGEKDPPDAWTRPSKPYILMDRSFGHAGYPAISVSFRGAGEFCKWLSAKTGRRFRLPTEAEWVHAALAGSQGPYACGDDQEKLGELAWYRANSIAQNRPSTHPIGEKAPNALGLHDVHGNAAEWTVAPDGTGVLRGGSFKDSAGKLAVTARLPDDPSFNASDPQIPQSVWWLADGPFAGFRVLCEP